jgi:hypothetical protein
VTVDAPAERLAAAIDAILAFLPDDAEPLLYDSDRRRTFDRLDEDVYVAACRAGLDGKLPAAQGAHLGYTRLPGWTDVAGTFCPWYVREWRQELLVLRRLALEPPAEGKKKRRRASDRVKADLAEMFRLRDEEGLTHYQIGRRYGVSADAVRMRLARSEKRRKKGR